MPSAGLEHLTISKQKDIMAKRTSRRTPIQVYGYTVLFKKPDDKHWTTEDDEELNILPSHYDFPEMAADRVKFLREKGYYARTLALLAEADDKSNLTEQIDEDK